ncbi:MAG TPA: energy-coupling factor transporter transmembrane component T [Bryobacteraceae bacterium]|nr:energy-coupling factor transporter transmembrane component T [Bryobacteraceae bacterium]
MHHVLIDQWSQRSSPLHRRDPRAKILVLLIFLVVLATTAPDAVAALVVYAALLVSAILIAGLPFAGLLLRAAAILPFSATFGLITWLAGDAWRAAGLVEKSYLSTVAVLVLVGTTPLPRLLGGLEALGTPRLLVLLAQFLYRYLFVVSEQAQHVRVAAACRAGRSQGDRPARFRAAAGALAVLFARSYYRAEGIHRAMMSRAFSGRFVLLSPLRFTLSDGCFTVATGALFILARVQ